MCVLCTCQCVVLLLLLLMLFYLSVCRVSAVVDHDAVLCGLCYVLFGSHSFMVYVVELRYL